MIADPRRTAWRKLVRGFVIISIVALHGAALGTVTSCLCPGDCDADCTTSSAEFRQVIEALFSADALAQCTVADTDADGRVTAADIVEVNRARAEPPPQCNRAPTATATATSTASNTPTASPSATISNTPTLPPPPTSSNTPTSPPPPTATPSPSHTVVATPVSRWIPLEPLARGARQEVGVAHLNGRIFVIGGFAPLPTDRVEAYDIATNQWIDIAPLPQAGHHIGAAVAGGQLYAIGGLRNPGFTPTSDVLRYDEQADRWDPVASLPTARGAMAVAVANDRIHAIAGDGVSSAVRDHAMYIPSENRWITLAAYPLALEHIAAAAVNNVVYVVGGRFPLSATAHRWDEGTEEWIALPDMPTNRAGHAVAALAGRLVTFGGEGNRANARGIFPEVESYDPSTNRWTSLAIMRVPRHGFGAIGVGTRIYAPGGADREAFGAVATNDALEIDF